MVAVTDHSALGAQENKTGHYFYVFPSHLPLSDGTGCHDLSFFSFLSAEF